MTEPSPPDFGSASEFYTFAPETLAAELPDYEILREVGKGSMGIVYEARRRADGQQVALKVLPPSLTLTERALARFLREAELMRRVRHPAIVRGIAHGRQGRLHYFAMEFVDGRTLQERVEVGPLPARQVGLIGAEVARALQVAHDSGVVHRDIKPGNLIQSVDGRVVITDFGLARETGTGSMTESGAIVGTPMYMAPEQIYGERGTVGTRADVYGLGATLYHLATGSSPFAGPTAQSVLKAVMDSDPPAPRRLRADLPKPLEAIILRAMEKEPARRFGSAEEMADDLDRFLAGERVLARRPGPLRQLQRVVGQHRAAALLSVAVAVLAFAGFALLGEARRSRLEGELRLAESCLARGSSMEAGQIRALSEVERDQLAERALSIATSVITADDGYARAWFVRAEAWHRLGRYPEAIRDLDRAEELLGAPNAEILYYRLDALGQIDDPAALGRLQQDLLALLEREPGPATRCLAAEILLDLALRTPSALRGGVLRRARDAIAAVREESARADIARARLLELSGSIDEAESSIRATRARYPDDPLVHRAAARLFQRLGLATESADAARVAKALGDRPDAGAGVPADGSERGFGPIVDVDELDVFLRQLDGLMTESR